jgi:hypothetical protein
MEQGTSEVSEQRSRRANGMKALETTRVEVESQRHLVGHQAKVIASALARVITLLEH